MAGESDTKIEVVINARIEQLAAQLNAAQAQVTKSAEVMAKVSEVKIQARTEVLSQQLKTAEVMVAKSTEKMAAAGGDAGSKLVGGMGIAVVRGMAMGVISTVIGGGILNAIKSVNAGESGAEMGKKISQGIIDGAKSIPIVGVFVSAMDELVNGMDRMMEKMAQKAIDATKNLNRGMNDARKTSESSAISITRSSEDMATRTPGETLDLNQSRLVEDTKAQLLKIKVDKKLLKDEANRTANAKQTDIQTKLRGSEQSVTEHIFDPTGEDRAAAEAAKNIAKVSLENARAKMDIDKDMQSQVDALNARVIAGAEMVAHKKAEIDKAAADDKAKTDAATAEKGISAAMDAATKAAKIAQDADKEAESNYDRFVAGNLADAKQYADGLIQIQRDRIDAEQAVQAQADNVNRVDRMASAAASGMIQSGNTAIGQFNFAQAGAASSALALAQRQVKSLEIIERASGEIVRLQKENAGFR